MVAFEYAAVYGCGDNRLFIVGGKNFYIFRSNDNVDWFFLFKAEVNTFKNRVAKFDFVVFEHNARKDIRFTDEVRNESVCRLVVNFFRRRYLLNFACSHNHDFIAHRKGFFLVVSDVNKGYAEVFVHAFKFELHILSHFKVKRAERFVQKQNFRFVYECSCYCDSLLLTAGEA